MVGYTTTRATIGFASRHIFFLCRSWSNGRRKKKRKKDREVEVERFFFQRA